MMNTFFLSAKNTLLAALVLFSCLFAFGQAQALDCVDDYGGSCQSACGAGGTEAVTSWGFAVEGPDIGCPYENYCCVTSCKGSGWTCLDSSSKGYCADSAPKILDCDDDEICCTKNACESAGSGYSCKALSECTSPTGNGALDDSCKALNSSRPVCCMNDPTKTYCDNRDPQYYYCAASCNSGDQTTSIICQDESNKCCKKATPSTGGGTSGGGGTPGAEQGFTYWNPLNCSSFTCLVESVLTGIQGIVGWLAVIFVVIGGVMYIVSGGSAMTNMAKATISWALVGFAIAVAAPTLMKEVYDLVSAGGSTGAEPIDSAKSIKDIVADVLVFLLSIVGVLGIIGFVVSGVLFVTSPGNSSQAETAKKAALYTIIGIVVSGAGLVMVRQILQLAAGTP